MRAPIAFAALALAACGGGSPDGESDSNDAPIPSPDEVITFVHTRASAELDCPPGEVAVAPIGYNTYDARGCGYNVIYVCVAGHGWIRCDRPPPLPAPDAGAHD